MDVVVLERYFVKGFADVERVRVFNETDVSHIASAKVDDIGGGTDET
jgi:hypothetical protein